VDSGSIGTKNPLTGQASSQSTRPSFGLVGRTSRYSPQATLNFEFLTRFDTSLRLDSAGSITRPFEDTVVFTVSKILSYDRNVKHLAGSSQIPSGQQVCDWNPGTGKGLRRDRIACEIALCAPIAEPETRLFI
jgi:hypothetical protein